jgi:hypothetical protein
VSAHRILPAVAAGHFALAPVVERTPDILNRLLLD